MLGLLQNPGQLSSDTCNNDFLNPLSKEKIQYIFHNHFANTSEPHLSLGIVLSVGVGPGLIVFKLTQDTPKESVFVTEHITNDDIVYFDKVSAFIAQHLMLLLLQEEWVFL